MPIKVFNFQLPIKSQPSRVMLSVVQNDIDGNKLIIGLTDNNKAFDITGATTVTFTALKEDNTISVGSATIEDALTGKISYVLTDQCVAIPGTVRVTIEIYQGTSRVTSSGFAYDVKPDLAVGADPSSSTEYPVLLTLMEDIGEIQAIEAARVIAEGNRSTAEGIRVTSEQGRVTAEGIRVTAEGNRNTAEGARSTAETARAGAETIRAGAETARNTAEGSRDAAEDLRISAENSRDAAEDVRAAAEVLRVGSEGGRITSETARATAEGLRSTAEGNRATAETGRSTAEGLRVTAETGRSTAEGNRVTAETARAGAETTRQSEHNAYKVMEPYEPSKIYVPLNKVTYAGSTYQAIVQSQGATPSTNPDKWLPIALKGADGIGAGDMLIATYDPDGDGKITPEEHKASHAIGGSDVLTPADIGAETPTGAQTKATAAETAAKAYADIIVAALVNSSPAALDTLNELAAALGNDANFATTVTNQIALKLDATTFNTHIADYVRNPAFGASGGAVNAYTFSAMAATAYVDGMKVYLDNVTAANTGASTLNWSGLGVKAIVDSKGVALTAGKMPLNCIIGLIYNASAGNFQLLGEGGEYGTLIAGDASKVLTGESFGTPTGVVAGTMVTYTKDGSGIVQALPNYADVYSNGTIDFAINTEGYVPSGFLRKIFANLIPSNIKKDTVIGDGVGVGIVGTLVAPTITADPGITNPFGSGLSVGGSGYQMAWENRVKFSVNVSGSFTFRFALKRTIASVTCYARLYKNGVAVGTLRTTSSTTATTYLEDFTCAAGDVFELKSYGSNTDGYVDITLASLFATVNDAPARTPLAL